MLLKRFVSYKTTCILIFHVNNYREYYLESMNLRLYLTFSSMRFSVSGCCLFVYRIRIVFKQTQNVSRVLLQSYDCELCQATKNA